MLQRLLGADCQVSSSASPQAAVSQPMPVVWYLSLIAKGALCGTHLCVPEERSTTLVLLVFLAKACTEMTKCVGSLYSKAFPQVNRS